MTGVVRTLITIQSTSSIVMGTTKNVQALHMRARTPAAKNTITIAGTTSIMTDTVIVPIFMQKIMVMLVAEAAAESMDTK